MPKIVPTISADLAENSAAAARRPVRGRGGSGYALLQQLVGGFGVDRGVVFALHWASVHDRLAFLRRDRPDPRRWRPYHDALDHRRRAVAFQERHQRLALAQLHDDLGRVELRIRPERLCGGRNRLLVTRREGAERMLHAVAELREHLVRHVDRILGHEIDADPFGADQPHHLFDLVHQRLRRIVEQQMRLVEEKDELGFRRIACLRQLLEQLRQHPQQEGRVQPRALHQLVGHQDVDHAPAVAVGAHEILQRQRRLAEKFRAALVFQYQQLALDGSDCRLGDVAEPLRGLADRRQRIVVAVSPLLAAVRDDRIQQRPKILHIDQCKAVVVGDTERNVQHAFLYIIQIKHPRQQQRPHFGDSGAHRMALLAEYIPKYRRELVGLEVEAHVAGPFDDEILGFADFGDAGEVSLDVGGKHGHARAREPLRHHLQRHGFSGSCGAGDEPVAIGKPERQPRRSFALPDKDLIVGIGQLVLKVTIASPLRASEHLAVRPPASYCMLRSD